MSVKVITGFDGSAPCVLSGVRSRRAAQFCLISLDFIANELHHTNQYWGSDCWLSIKTNKTIGDIRDVKIGGEENSQPVKPGLMPGFSN